MPFSTSSNAINTLDYSSLIFRHLKIIFFLKSLLALNIKDFNNVKLVPGGMLQLLKEVLEKQLLENIYSLKKWVRYA